ncbi:MULTISPECIES: hypothetical protein [Moraxella]|uniref:DUF551 domain-containing protein n=1 Tax=Moraxella lacunata TaxID=477 RepID=A0A1B8Q4Z0_MORLA|nr:MULTISPECIES: hypothetical protein [Moraxella]MBE9577880.1 hypothetical protein [Moraxella sp. K1664]MBE9587302.1 hypothetical protein [Moraxella sp. K1630]MBE9595546.1 hypothetical protein [Moraxella sp. K2450]MDH9218162.1 hypothetical protein [Moraxella lacunata]MDI4481919.1 hypothetical protein [Moraxella lacunata]
MTAWHEYPKTKPRFNKKRKSRMFCEFLCVSLHKDGGFVYQTIDKQFYDFDKKCFVTGNDKITHWAEMPEPPKLAVSAAQLLGLE